MRYNGIKETWGHVKTYFHLIGKEYLELSTKNRLCVMILKKRHADVLRDMILEHGECVEVRRPGPPAKYLVPNTVLLVLVLEDGTQLANTIHHELVVIPAGDWMDDDKELELPEANGKEHTT